jgi:membrane protein implicated in regulation of membrane protease activity
VSATGAGPTVSTVATLRHSTPLLFSLFAVLVLEAGYLTYRWLTRRRLRKQSAQGDAVGDDDVTVEERVPHYTA